MRRLPVTIALAVLLLASGAIALVPVAGACGDALCLTDEESRRGGDCGPEDGQPADYYRYFNLTIQAGDVRVHSTSTFACENQYIAHQEKMWTNVTIGTPGRADQVRALYTYGALHDGCTAGAGVFFDRILIFNNLRVGQGVSRHCGETNRIPSVAEALP